MNAVIEQSNGQMHIPHTPPSAILSPLEMVRMRIAECQDLAQLEKLMDLEKRWHTEQSQRAYTAAFAEFKRNMPVVVKDMINKQYGSDYTSLANLVNTTNRVLGEYGFNARWDVIDGSPANGVVCLLSHVAGHTERVVIKGPLDVTGQKNDLQKIKSTLTYLEGATFQAITGVVARSACLDDDGNAAGAKLKQEAERPDGLDVWMADCKSAADEGSAKLGEFWAKANDDIRRFIKTHEEPWFNQLRRNAAKVTAAQKVAT